LRDQEVFVYAAVQDEEGHYAVQREIRVGARSDGYLEVLDGVEPGDIIVRQGVHRIRDGARIEPRDDGDSARTASNGVAAAGQGIAAGSANP